MKPDPKPGAVAAVVEAEGVAAAVVVAVAGAVTGKSALLRGQDQTAPYAGRVHEALPVFL